MTVDHGETVEGGSGAKVRKGQGGGVCKVTSVSGGSVGRLSISRGWAFKSYKERQKVV